MSASAPAISPRQRSDVACIVDRAPAGSAVAARVSAARALPAAVIGPRSGVHWRGWRQPPRTDWRRGGRARADAGAATSVKAASSTSATARRSVVAKLAR
jgi:hypothetical protein